MTCTTHYCDNQGLCHRCGKLMEPDWWRAYAGSPHPDEEQFPDSKIPKKQKSSKRRDRSRESLQ